MHLSVSEAQECLFPSAALGVNYTFAGFLGAPVEDPDLWDRDVCPHSSEARCVLSQTVTIKVQPFG